MCKTYSLTLILLQYTSSKVYIESIQLYKICKTNNSAYFSVLLDLSVYLLYNVGVYNVHTYTYTHYTHVKHNAKHIPAYVVQIRSCNVFTMYLHHYLMNKLYL